MCQHPRLTDISRTYGMASLFSNTVGLSEGAHCGGKSSARNRSGELVGKLDAEEEGIVLYDTETEDAVTQAVTQAV
jgi:hypothetical protein